jgi:hypothetical protein
MRERDVVPLEVDVVREELVVVRPVELMPLMTRRAAKRTGVPASIQGGLVH